MFCAYINIYVYRCIDCMFLSTTYPDNKFAEIRILLNCTRKHEQFWTANKFGKIIFHIRQTNYNFTQFWSMSSSYHSKHLTVKSTKRSQTGKFLKNHDELMYRKIPFHFILLPCYLAHALFNICDLSPSEIPTIL